jgi:hypothetical protein
MEYRFNCGNYRHFIVTADSEEQAKERFDKASKLDDWPTPTMGFTLKDVTSIIPLSPN